MKDTKLMRKNARFRWSWEHGGDLISLTFRVAAVVNGVIGGLKGGRGCRCRIKILRILGQKPGVCNYTYPSFFPKFWFIFEVIRLSAAV